MTLEQRSTDWKQKLRSDYPDEARFVVQQLLRPLKLWFGTKEDIEQGDDLREHYGFALRDPENEEELSECGFTAVVRPAGLLNGLVAASLVAGAGFEPATFGL